MDTMLKSLFGGQGGDPHAQAQDFVGRYEQGPPWTNFSGQEAYQRYQQVAGQVPPDVYQQSAEEAFRRMAPDERAQFAAMLQQRMGSQQGGWQTDDPRQLAQVTSQFHQQDPGGLAALFGGGGRGGGGLGDALENPIAKAAIGGIAAMAVKQVMGRR